MKLFVISKKAVYVGDSCSVCQIEEIKDLSVSLSVDFYESVPTFKVL